MTRENCKALLPILQAFAEGKTIQYDETDAGGWVTLTGVSLNFDDFHPRRFRIKPEPKYRPWKPEEVPVGAQIRIITAGLRGIITSVSSVHSSMLVGQTDFKIANLHMDAEVSTDNGKTWSPCGVLEG